MGMDDTAFAPAAGIEVTSKRGSWVIGDVDSSVDELEDDDDDDNDDLLSAAVAAVEAEDKESKKSKKR